MLSAIRPSSEVVKEGRMFLTEKMSWEYPYQQEQHLMNSDDV